MSNENKGVTGAASLRLQGRKISELPLALRTRIDQEIPAFIESQRKNKVDLIIARYPKGNIPMYEAMIRECEQNQQRMVQAKADCFREMEIYQELIRNNEGRDAEEVDAEIAEMAACYWEPHKDNAELWDAEKNLPIPGTLVFQELRKRIKALNAQKKPYDDDGLWKQFRLFQESRDRYDEVVKKEAESIMVLREAINLMRQRDALISKALTEPIAVE